MSDAVVIEIDEMCHYLKKVQLNLEMEGLLSRFRTAYRLGAWCRDAGTFERLKSRLDKWEVRLICTDGYNVYDNAYRPGKHYIGKDQTYRL